MHVIEINKFIFFFFQKGSLIQKIENIFPCSFRVIEALVGAWEKLEIAWKYSHFALVFPRNLSFLPNFHACFYIQGESKKSDDCDMYNRNVIPCGV